METIAVKVGMWMIEQNSETFEVSLKKYGAVIENWTGDRLYSFNELHDMLANKTKEIGGLF